MLRVFNALVYAVFAALGAALVAPPLLASVEALVKPYSHVPQLVAPWLWLALAAALFLSLADVARRVFARRRVGMLRYIALLALVGLIGAARKGLTAPPRPTVADALPHLMARVERALDVAYARDRQYPTDAALLTRDVPPVVRDLGYRRRGARPLKSRLIVVTDASGPIFVPPEGTHPGDTVLALSKDRRAYWLTAFDLGVTGRASPHTAGSGRVVVANGRDGHASSRQDPLFPNYPRKSPPRSPTAPDHR